MAVIQQNGEEIMQGELNIETLDPPMKGDSAMFFIGVRSDSGKNYTEFELDREEAERVVKTLTKYLKEGEES